MAPILPAADEEGLDRYRPRLAGEREHVGVAKALGMYSLAALDVGQRAQPVAIDGGQFIILPARRVSHRPRLPRLHTGRLAGEELLRLGDQLGIILVADPAHARRRAALDLIEQTGPC